MIAAVSGVIDIVGVDLTAVLDNLCLEGLSVHDNVGETAKGLI